MKLPHLNDLSLGCKVDSETGELEVISQLAEGEKVIIELRKVEEQELIKEI